MVVLDEETGVTKITAINFMCNMNICTGDWGSSHDNQSIISHIIKSDKCQAHGSVGGKKSEDYGEKINLYGLYTEIFAKRQW